MPRARALRFTSPLERGEVEPANGWSGGGDLRIDRSPAPRRASRADPPPPAGGWTRRDPRSQNLAAAAARAAVGRDRRAVERRDEDRRPAAEISAAGGLRRPHLSGQSRGATRCWASAPGRRSPRCRRCPSTSMSWRRPTPPIEAIEECGRLGVPVVTALANGFSETGAGGRRARGAAARDRRARPASASSARRASASSTCGTSRSSPPTPRSTSRTCRSAASSRPRIPAA